MVTKKRKEKSQNGGEETKEKSTAKTSVKSPANSSADDGSRTVIPYKRMAVRFVVLAGSMLALNVYTHWGSSDQSFAGRREELQRRAAAVACSNDYDKEKNKYPECFPKRCGRVVMDNIVTSADAEHLLRMAKAGLAHGGSNGGASILDMHSGALSKGSQFVNIYKIMLNTNEKIFTEKDFKIYKKVKNAIHRAIATEFGVPLNKLFLTSPTFFSRMTTKPAKTIHDEYWHTHVDKETYGSFHYTSLLYLSTYDVDFHGGRFVFVDESRNTTVEPKLGRLSFFTSGSENPHFVERVSSGTRYAITVSFTCDPEKAIADPDASRGQQ